MGSGSFLLGLFAFRWLGSITCLNSLLRLFSVALFDFFSSPVDSADLLLFLVVLAGASSWVRGLVALSSTSGVVGGRRFEEVEGSLPARISSRPGRSTILEMEFIMRLKSLLVNFLLVMSAAVISSRSSCFITPARLAPVSNWLRVFVGTERRAFWNSSCPSTVVWRDFVEARSDFRVF